MKHTVIRLTYKSSALQRALERRSDQDECRAVARFESMYECKVRGRVFVGHLYSIGV